MPEKMKLFTKILIAELEDLENDLQTWGKYLEEKHKSDKISEYVFLENNALLRRELLGLKTMVLAIGHKHPTNLPDIESIKEYYLALVKREADKYEFQAAILAFATKKIEKVYGYLKE